MSEFNLFDFFREANEHHRIQENEYERLKADIPRKVNIGDKVIVAIGLLGHGFRWIRQECEVIETASNSTKIRLQEKHLDGSFYEYWIDPALIIDVIEKRQ